MTPKELCQTQHAQMCHVCDDWQCGDNCNPIKSIIEIYEKYKHLDGLLSDKGWFSSGDFKYSIMSDLWQAIKGVIEKGGD